MSATGVRVSGPAGGAQRFITIAELDALSAPVPTAWPTFDLNADGRVDAADVAEQARAPRDLTGDGVIDAVDLEYLRAAASWRGLRRDQTQ